jgi:hypothetical protein
MSSRTGGYEPDPGAYELKGVLIGSVGCSRKSQKAVYYVCFFFHVWSASNEGVMAMWDFLCSPLSMWDWTHSDNTLPLVALFFRLWCLVA